MVITLTLILLIGLTPFGLGAWLTIARLRSHSAQMQALQRGGNPSERRTPTTFWPSTVGAEDARYVEGLGYIVGNILCRYNARSASLRCAVNPSGPCDGCLHYEEIAIAPFPPAPPTPTETSAPAPPNHPAYPPAG